MSLNDNAHSNDLEWAFLLTILISAYFLSAFAIETFHSAF